MLSFLSALGILTQIARGLEFLHQNGEMHRDLKPRNGTYRPDRVIKRFNFLAELLTDLVLLSIVEPGWKISDFGLTSEGASRMARTTRYARGTNCYRAPELIKDDSTVSMKSDVFALGCILYELVASSKAFENDWSIFNYISMTKRMPEVKVPEHVDDHVASYLKQLIHRMMEVDWWRRPPVREILRLLDGLAENRNVIWDLKDGTFCSQVTSARLHKNWNTLKWEPVWLVPMGA